MKNKSFTIENICIEQNLCAMKVGTDGVLLGKWCFNDLDSVGECSALDIGTGTGLLALLISKRFPKMSVDAIDIDEGAYKQALLNVTNNGFKDKIIVHKYSLQDYTANNEKKYDFIVCNPPYFQNSLKCPDNQRNTARHTDTLSFSDLFHNVKKLLTEKGKFSIIIPTEVLQDVNFEAASCGMFLCRQCEIKTTPRKATKRYMLEFSNIFSELKTETIVLNN